MIKNFLRRAITVLFAACLTGFFFTACENSEEVGLDLTSPGERFHYVIDSTSVLSAATLRQDSLTSEKRTSSLLGSMNDPIFGRTTAHLLTQLRLSSNDVDFGTTPVIDSVVLLMKYQTWYGDTTTTQKVRVYELQKDLYFDSTYYSNFDMTGFYDPAMPIADFSYLPTPERDSVLIRLSDDFGQKLITTDTAYLTNNTEWLKYFRGLYLEAQATDQAGSIISYNFTGGKSRMTLYYHNEANDSLKYEIVINSNSTWINRFEHDYTGVQAGTIINDSLYSHPEAYLHGAAGSRAHIRIQFPDTVLAQINSGIAVNKAELIIRPASDPTIDRFERPKTLRVFNARPDGTNEFIDDLTLGEAYYGGIYDDKTQTYRFNIGRHMQNLLYPDSTRRKANTGLFLVLADERTSAARMVIDNSPGAIQLILTYTPLR